MTTRQPPAPAVRRRNGVIRRTSSTATTSCSLFFFSSNSRSTTSRSGWPPEATCWKTGVTGRDKETFRKSWGCHVAKQAWAGISLLLAGQEKTGQAESECRLADAGRAG